MERYLNINGNSGVNAYEIGDDYIRVRFIDNSVYRYTHASAGPGTINQMKILARRGRSLCTFINQNVKKIRLAELQSSFPCWFDRYLMLCQYYF